MRGEYITDPAVIEKRSMEIIAGELGDVRWEGGELAVVKRVIHTTADFEFAQLLEFKHNPVEAVATALRSGCHIVTDTRMALSGINKNLPSRYGCEVKCFIAHPEVAAEARERGLTRAMVSMEYAARDKRNKIFVIGNAPTALYALIELIQDGVLYPAAIIGVPVGFVGAAESKDALSKLAVPQILTRGRKGGSNIAAAIINAISYTCL